MSYKILLFSPSMTWELVKAPSPAATTSLLEMVSMNQLIEEALSRGICDTSMIPKPKSDPRQAFGVPMEEEAAPGNIYRLVGVTGTGVEIIIVNVKMQIQTLRKPGDYDCLGAMAVDRAAQARSRMIMLSDPRAKPIKIRW
jgi:hypothetical protein